MQSELLRSIIEQLDASGLQHMVAGSFASTYHGEPRMTRDIDLVIEPDEVAMAAFSDQLDRNRYYMPDWREELARRGMVNVIDTTTGWKIDLIFRKDRPFSESEFARRRRVDLSGVTVHMATAEDTILAKLEWAKASGSERQLDDVRAMIAIQDVDEGYLDEWADALGVADLLEALLRRSSPESGSG